MGYQKNEHEVGKGQCLGEMGVKGGYYLVYILLYNVGNFQE